MKPADRTPPEFYRYWFERWLKDYRRWHWHDDRLPQPNPKERYQ